MEDRNSAIFIENLSEKLLKGGYREPSEAINNIDLSSPAFDLALLKLSKDETRVVVVKSMHKYDENDISNSIDDAVKITEAIKAAVTAGNWKIYAEVIFVFYDKLDVNIIKNIKNIKKYAVFEQVAILPIAVELSTGRVERYQSPPFGGVIKEVIASCPIAYTGRRGLLRRLSDIGRIIPFATIAISFFIVMLNVAFYVAGLIMPDSQYDLLFAIGTLYKPAIQTGEYWRIILSSMFFIDIIHFVISISAFWIFGSLAENIFGSVRFLVICILGIIGGNVFGYAFGGFSTGIGMGAPLFAIAGALLANALLDNAFRLPMKFYIVLLINIAYSFVVLFGDESAFINLYSFAGGLLTGVLFGYVFSYYMRRREGPAVAYVPAGTIADGITPLNVNKQGVLLSHKLAIGLWCASIIVSMLIGAFGPEKHFYLAKKYSSEENMAEAARQMEFYLERRQDSAEGWRVLGDMRMNLDDYDGAYTAYKNCVEIDGGSVEAHFGCGEAAFRMGINENSIEPFDTAVEEFGLSAKLAESDPAYDGLRFSAEQRAALVLKYKSRMMLKSKFGRRKWR